MIEEYLRFRKITELISNVIWGGKRQSLALEKKICKGRLTALVNSEIQTPADLPAASLEDMTSLGSGAFESLPESCVLMSIS